MGPVFWGDCLSFLDFLEVYFLCHTGEVLLHYFFKLVFNLLLFLFSFWHPYDSDVGMLKVSQRFLSLLIFLKLCFFILFQLNVYFFLLLQIIDLSPSSLPFTVGSL